MRGTQWSASERSCIRGSPEDASSAVRSVQIDTGHAGVRHDEPASWYVSGYPLLHSLVVDNADYKAGKVCGRGDREEARPSVEAGTRTGIVH